MSEETWSAFTADELLRAEEEKNDDSHDPTKCPWCLEMQVDASVMDDITIIRPKPIIYESETP